jgi:hypothetical protein
VPLQLTRGDRKILSIAGGILLVMIVATVFLARGRGSERDVPSTYSTASGGARAAYLLLKESGYRSETWEQPLHELPEGQGKVLVIADPERFPSKEDRQRVEMFLQTGGRLIVAGPSSAYGLPLNESSPESAPGSIWKHYSSLSPSPITGAAPEITLVPRAYWKPGTGAVGLYGEPDKPVVIEYKFGKGDVLWLADDTPLTNAGLKEAGNLEFLLAALGNRGENEILWDEYVHGYELASPVHTSTRVIAWVGLQFAVLTAAILLSYSRRSGPIWLPQTESRLSPLEFVRTLGSLYEQANAGGVAVDIYYQRFRFLLTRRLGLSLNAPAEDLARAVRDRFGFAENTFADTLRECDGCRYDPDIPPATCLHLVQTLFDYAQRLKLPTSSRQEKTAWKR